MMRKPCFLFDIDGTLANGDHRLHHIKKEPKDWSAYFAACPGDQPIHHMLALLDHVAAGWEPIMAFDDRDRVVAAWRAAGIPCAQVAPGDF